MEKSFDELMDSDLELNESVFDYPEEVLQSREDVIESDNNELDDETWTSQTQPTLGSSANSNESAIDEDLNDNTRKATDHHNMVPSHIREAAEKARSNLLPKKSNSSYMFAYHKFKTWLVKNELNVDSIDRDIMLAYFNKLKEKYKPSSLWATYSKLRSTISTYHNINIHNFSQLIQFLKNANKVYRSVQALALTEEQVRTCLLTAPDQIYLDVKVVWILGMYGACHRCELKNLKITDFKEKGDDLEFFLDETKTDNPRSYVVPQPLCTKVKDYIALRPDNCKLEDFFLNYTKGKCTRQPIGINKIGNMAKEVAVFLNLTNANRYTSHCIRHTSATCFANTGASGVALKQLEGWKSTEIAHGYCQNSLHNKRKIARSITDSILEAPSTSTSTAHLVSKRVPSFESSKFNALRNQVSTTPPVALTPSQSSVRLLQNTKGTNPDKSSRSAHLVIENKENLTLSDLLQNINDAKNINFNFTNCPNLSIYFGKDETERK